MWIWSNQILLSLRFFFRLPLLVKIWWFFPSLSICYADLLILFKQYHWYVSYPPYIFLFAVYDLVVLPLDLRGPELWKAFLEAAVCYSRVDSNIRFQCQAVKNSWQGAVASDCHRRGVLLFLCLWWNARVGFLEV